MPTPRIAKVGAASRAQVSDPDILNKLTYRINSDPYSLTQGDIVSAEGISLADKNKALDELRRNQEITNRPNYKAARELFDIDFKQQFGPGAIVDPEDQAKWLRVFHSYIIDKKMEPMDAAEKIRKDYTLQDNPPPAPSQEGNVINPPPEGDSVKATQAGTTQSPPGNQKQSPPGNQKQSPPGNQKQSPPGRGRGGLDKSETQNASIDPTDSLFTGIGKSAMQGLTSFPRTFWGAGAMLEDITKSVPQAIPLAAFSQIIPEDFFKRRYEDVKGIEERFQAKGEGYKKYINGAVRTMSEMFSQYAGTAGLGTLFSMFAGAGIDKYLEARKEGYSVPRSFAAGGVTTITEYVTEKTPLEILGRPGLKFVDRLMKGLISDIPGEIEATLVEMATVDQAILGKSYTPKQYLWAVFDTILTAAGTTIGSTGVTHPFVRGTRSPVSPSEQPQQTQETQAAQQTPEIKQPAKEEVPGVKPAETKPYVIDKNLPKNTIVGSEKEIGSIYDYIKSNTNPSNELKAVRYQTVNHDEAIKLKESIGLELEGYHHTVNNYGTQHALNSHSDAETEIKRGQIAITKEDIQKIPQIVNTYDKVELAGKDDAGNDVIQYTKKINGEIYYLEEVRNKRHELTIKSMWKKGTPEPSDASSQTPSQKITEKPPTHTSEANSGNPTNTIQQSQVSVKPDIQLMPPLKDLVDTAKLSLEDALEINDIAKQNNWSDDTVKQFYKNAVEGLGIQNKDTASLEQMLITAKIKETVYKQNAEKYKEEIAINQKLLDQIYSRLKIQGGAPDKYETAANDFLKNLGDLEKLEPETIIQKAQEELALNINRLDTDMDVKTLITAAAQTINEAEGISQETVSHEQTVQEALRELPGIYSKVMGMKRGKPLTRPQQLAARMLGTALFETFNKTKMLGMADTRDVKLYQQAQTQLVELGQYWSKVLASSSEIGRMLEAQKIIAKVGEDIPATEEFQKVLGMLQGQKEISPEQFYQLTDTLKNPEQLAEMARELARPVSRNIQDVFLEAWINGLLSNPQTHATNFLSNLYTAFASIPERYLATKTHYGDKPSVVDGEAKAMLYGMQMGFRDAVNAARIAWATETGH